MECVSKTVDVVGSHNFFKAKGTIIKCELPTYFSGYTMRTVVSSCRVDNFYRSFTSLTAIKHVKQLTFRYTRPVAKQLIFSSGTFKLDETTKSE